MSDSFLSSLQSFLTCGARSQRKSFRSTYNEQLHESVRHHCPSLSSRNLTGTEASAQTMTSSLSPPYEFKDPLPVRETSARDQAEAPASGSKGGGLALKGNKSHTRTDGSGKWQHRSSVLRHISISCVQAIRLQKVPSSAINWTASLKLTLGSSSRK